MASALGRRLTEAHRIAQARLAAATADELMPLWRMLDLLRLDETSPDWVNAALAVIAQQRQASIGLAANYLTTFRALELGSSAPPFTLPTLPDLNRVSTATSLLVTGPIDLKSRIGRGIPFDRAVQMSLAGSTSAGTRHAINGARDLVVAAGRADPQATGMVRVTSPGACNFCEEIAEHSHGNPALGSDFETHDGCNCHPELLYG